ncbi:MAG TPA: exodeoxyribonuclease V subunit alpha [Polyangiaceae bacterium]|nr:exodeoxyribonuclease V subunit alpha [Polyangiaceae bacterium]
MTSPSLERLVELALVSVFDRELALALAELGGETRVEVLLGAAFASAAVQAGHTCADIARLAERRLEDTAGAPLEGLALPAERDWLDALRTSPIVTVAERDAPGERPLVLDGRGRLYLERYFEYEGRLSRALLARAAEAVPGATAPAAASLARLFPPEDVRGALQRTAALVFLERRLTVVSGGPGTGKTYTVCKALALLQEQARAAGREPYRVLLTAPTGKAAQRLGDAIRATVERLGLDAAALGIPTQASTLHRALGFQPAKPTHLRRNAQHPLAEDVVVVDEASMVDLALMAKLVDAVRPDARLLLLGDKDQLASVEAGAILADIYAGSAQAGAAPSGSARAPAKQGPGLERHGLAAGLVHLTESHRFGDDGAIAALARAVNAGDATEALRVLGRGGSVALARVGTHAELEAALAPLVADRFGELLAGSPAERLARLERFRVLAAHRRGPFGVEGLNASVARELAKRDRLEPRGLFYDGRPVIVVANDYEIELFNGDTGVLAPGEAPLRAWFRGAKPGTLREVSPARLPRHETAFALSVHKSQGSEFDEIAFVLPERPSPVLTRELVYTAVTRARRQVTIIGSEAVLAHAIAARVERASGLAERLWGRSTVDARP